MNTIEFTLSGKKYRLSRADVEEALRHVTPKPIDKYFVPVLSRRFPPKQALGVSIGKTRGFTTMAANAVLERLGFEICTITEETTPMKTQSELLFESFLNSRGYLEFKFEHAVEGASARPDYLLPVPDQGTVKEIMFEVKEFQPTDEDFRAGGGAFDPYEPIRRKIQEGRKKFREFRQHCCALVLFNAGKLLIDLQWRFIYAAMLGNLAIRIPFSRERGIADGEAKTVFGPGGEMHRHREGVPMEPQNTTISAIVVLEHLEVGKLRFDLEVFRKERETGRDLAYEEFARMIDRHRGTECDISLTQIRAVVCQNPYARIQFPHGILHGPYDEVFGVTDGGIARIFAGELIEKLEAEAKSIGYTPMGPLQKALAKSRQTA